MAARHFHWIAGLEHGGLTTMPHPAGFGELESSLLAWKNEGIDIVVSMLPLGEAMLLGLANEETLCQQHGMEFHNLVVRDMQTPASQQPLLDVVDYLHQQLDADKKIAIHCRMGIGRASVMAACVLVAQGAEVNDAFARISRARGRTVPDNPAQVAWVHDIAQRLQRGKNT